MENIFMSLHILDILCPDSETDVFSTEWYCKSIAWVNPKRCQFQSRGCTYQSMSWTICQFPLMIDMYVLGLPLIAA